MDKHLAIVTPVYATPVNNRLRYFMDTSGSVLSHNEDFKWIVVDDSSTDPGLKEFLRSISDPRLVVLLRERKQGDLRTASNALNHGIEYVVGQGNFDCFTYLHSDDILAEGSLTQRMTALDGSNMVYGQMLALSKGKQHTLSGIYENPSDPANLADGFPHHSSMWSISFLNAMYKTRGGQIFDPQFSYGEDRDVTLCSRKFIEDGKFGLGYIDDIVYIYLQNDGNITSETSAAERNRQIREILLKNGYPSKSFDLNELLHDLFRRPGYFLPEEVKKLVRPFKQGINKISAGFFFPNTHTVNADQLQINPYWFRTN